MTSPAGQPPACPPWCAGDGNHDLGIHVSAREPIPVLRVHGHGSGSGSGVCASACQVDGGPPSPRVLVIAFAPRSSGASIYCEDTGQARRLADLLDFMASATARQHRDLAAQVRRAAALIDSGGR
jgi:hypothetical protein